MDLRAAGERIDALLVASASSGAVARERAEELVRLVTDLYGAGLERMMDILYDNGHLDEKVLIALAGDELVASLLLVHGLHPYDAATRVEQALENVRPYLGSHGGDVELVGVSAEGTVRLRLLGTCDGCPSSSVTLTLAVEDAIRAAAPEVTAIEVETAEPAHELQGTVIPVEALTARLHSPAADPSSREYHSGASWQLVPELADVPAGGVALVAAGPMTLLGCRIGSDLFAFRDRCARCESSLGGAALARRLGGAAGDAVLRCPTCSAHYDVRLAGACLEDPGLHLEPLPVLASDAGVSVALPTAVSV
jgi:Fe-S cluster biogenesis protein NfuA/nitrite reductase/ring-hydroxylating ferredoxin subunit